MNRILDDLGYAGGPQGPGGAFVLRKGTHHGDNRQLSDDSAVG
jgi:hypothetical protein